MWSAAFNVNVCLLRCLLLPRRPQNRALRANLDAHVTEHSVRRMQTMPGIKSLSMKARYPIAEVDYEIPGFPVTVSMEAMTPLIPNDAKNSSLPCAVFSFTVTNPGATAVEVNLMQSQQNFVGWNGQDDCTVGTNKAWGSNVNTPTQSATLAGLMMSAQGSSPAAKTQPGFGTIAALGVCAPHTKVTVIPQAASESDLWAAFAGGKFAPTTAAPTAPSASGASYCGGTVQTVTVPAGGSATVDFILAWHFPNRNWAGAATHKDLVTGNMYNNWFDAWLPKRRERERERGGERERERQGGREGQGMEAAIRLREDGLHIETDDPTITVMLHGAAHCVTHSSSRCALWKTQ